ncbi:MAG TPA: sigma 54-interacting transcriptional regulator [Gemmatimonadaceae bacterium]
MLVDSPLLVDRGGQVELARNIARLSYERWGAQTPTLLIGRHRKLSDALEKLGRLAVSDSPVLITGETGTGKELFARALYLLSARTRAPFLSINCGRYPEAQLVASELFGHKRGSFTGAVSDHRGIFEEADGGVVFLDEIGELCAPAQAMLLRLLSEGDIRPVGASHAKHVNVRVVAATNRDLRAMIASGTFHADLYYRLRYLQVHVPPVRERGDDWELIADYHLKRLGTRGTVMKSFSREARTLLGEYPWPGNVRELVSVVDTGFHLSDGPIIEPSDFTEQLEDVAREEQLGRIPLSREPADLMSRMTTGGETFWDAVYRPFMDRELSRADVRDLVGQGLIRTRGSYKKLLGTFRIAETDYLRFMDFLRHQRLKPGA